MPVRPAAPGVMRSFEAQGSMGDVRGRFWSRSCSGERKLVCLSILAGGKVDYLFDAAFLSRVESLSLLARKIRRGRLRAERRSIQRGASVEFSEYRHFVNGDDWRYIDWNAYARWRQLVMKLFVEEEGPACPFAAGLLRLDELGDSGEVRLCAQGGRLRSSPTWRWPIWTAPRFRRWERCRVLPGRPGAASTASCKSCVTSQAVHGATCRATGG